MVSSLLRSRISGGGVCLVTRDCPNVIVPTLAFPKQLVPGVNWAWGAQLQIHAGLGYDFVLKQLITTPGIGEILYGNGSSLRFYLEQYQISTLVDQAYTPIAEAEIADCQIAIVSGISLDSPIVQLIDIASKTIPCGPVTIPAGVAFTARASINIAPTTKATSLYLSGYDKATFKLIKVPYIDKAYYGGDRATYPQDMPLLSTTSISNVLVGIWNMGSWVTVEDPLDADYLVDAGYAIPLSGAPASGIQIDVGLGDVGGEVIQARYAISTTGILQGACHDEFPHSFIAYKGERLAARFASGQTTKGIGISIHKVKLG